MHVPVPSFSRRKFAFVAVLFCSAILALLLPGCGGSNSSDTVASISVTPPSASVNVNVQQQFSAQALDANDNQVLNQTFTWTSSDTTVATVAGSGVATGVSAGTAMITATAGGITSQPVTLTVTAVVTNVTLSPASSTVAVGGTQQLMATAYDANGKSVPATITWQNSSAAIATISTSGLVTGVSPGTVMITATANGVASPVATVTVTP